MILYRSVVIEQQILPIGIGGYIVRIGIFRSLSCVYQTFVLHNHIAGSVEHIAMLPSCLPTLREVVVDSHLTQLTLLGSNQDNTVSSTSTIDGT